MERFVREVKFTPVSGSNSGIIDLVAADSTNIGTAFDPPGEYIVHWSVTTGGTDMSGTYEIFLNNQTQVKSVYITSDHISKFRYESGTVSISVIADGSNRAAILTIGMVTEKI